MERHGLKLEQIGYRRQIRADFRGLTAQEYAEDAESCFLASGESVFELAAVEARLKTAPEPVERRKNGELEIWLPPVKGKEYMVAVDPAGGGSEGDYSAAQVRGDGDGAAVRGVCRARGRTGAGAAGDRAGHGVQRRVAGGGAEQPWHGRAGAGGDGVQVRASLPAEWAGGLADDEREPAGRCWGGWVRRWSRSRSSSRAGGCWASAGALCGCRMATRERRRERTTTG